MFELADEYFYSVVHMRIVNDIGVLLCSKISLFDWGEVDVCLVTFTFTICLVKGNTLRNGGSSSQSPF